MLRFEDVDQSRSDGSQYGSQRSERVTASPSRSLHGLPSAGMEDLPRSDGSGHLARAGAWQPRRCLGSGMGLEGLEHRMASLHMQLPPSPRRLTAAQFVCCGPPGCPARTHQVQACGIDGWVRSLLARACGRAAPSPLQQPHQSHTLALVARAGGGLRPGPGCALGFSTIIQPGGTELL
ncbi:hypothetical protein ACKKBG_A02170 [Auxenochlorella protothecoides x Auxenochlorella symbiontica]